MKRDVIQSLLDDCLLTDEEMTLGPEMWKETMEEFDNINLELEEEECQVEECEDEDCDKNEVESGDTWTAELKSRSKNVKSRETNREVW